jgi:glycosyltransferase involved in cell wall biosynthesis
MIPEVSILVPVYNVSDYIERCAHSIFQQTFENIEYVFVNDCTVDDSIEKLQKVIEQYPNRKPLVKIINHKKNRGLAAARNTAIDNSTGKYIQHVDSDDWIELDMTERMYNMAIEKQADVVVCDLIIEKTNTKKIIKDLVPEKKEDYFISMLASISCGNLWNKLVRRNLYKLPDCRSVEGLNLLEDLHVTVRLAYYAEKTVKIDRIFYHYNKTNINSITASKTTMHYENGKLYHDLLEKFLKEKKLYEEYFDIVEFSKVSLKTELLVKTRNRALRKQYAWLYRDIEMKYFKRFRLGEKIILFCTHYGFHTLAQWAYLLIWWKNKKNTL